MGAVVKYWLKNASSGANVTYAPVMLRAIKIKKKLLKYRYCRIAVEVYVKYV